MSRLLSLTLSAALAGVAGLTVAGSWVFGPNRDRYEEPGYEVEVRHSVYEVRKYEPTIQAKTTIGGTRERATREGFQILAGYIFGGNRGKQSIAMTTPVSAAPQTIEMTAPVSATSSRAGWVVGFTMPRQWTLDTLPVPDDSRVQLVAVSEHRAAVRTFTGRANAMRIAEEERLLFAALKAQGMLSTGRATLAQFDPPWVLGPWRRNEIQVELYGPQIVEHH